MTKIILATHNKGKISELAPALATLGCELIGLQEYPELGDIPETGTTFEQNALIKARTVARATGLVAIADDSGLMVDALNGAPGVYSARFADDWPLLPGESRDQRNIRKLLYALRKQPQHNRAAHFCTFMAAVAPQGQELIVQGQWHGIILEAPLGEHGFGYDPVFWDPFLEKSAAQLTRAEKNSVSHRGKAVKALLEKWSDFLKSSCSA